MDYKSLKELAEKLGNLALAAELTIKFLDPNVFESMSFSELYKIVFDKPRYLFSCPGNEAELAAKEAIIKKDRKDLPFSDLLIIYKCLPKYINYENQKKELLDEMVTKAGEDLEAWDEIFYCGGYEFKRKAAENLLRLAGDDKEILLALCSKVQAPHSPGDDENLKEMHYARLSVFSKTIEVVGNDVSTLSKLYRMTFVWGFKDLPNIDDGEIRTLISKKLSTFIKTIKEWKFIFDKAIEENDYNFQEIAFLKMKELIAKKALSPAIVA